MILAGPGEVIMQGQLLVALPLALLAGLISFASPCVLPVVPGYLGLVGATSTDGRPDARGAGDTHGATDARGAVGASGGGATSVATATAPGRLRVGSRGRVVLGAALFVLGFSLVYVLTGAAFGQLGVWLIQYQGVVLRVLGAVVIVMGLVFLGQVGLLQRQWKPAAKPIGLVGAPLLGIIFGVGWAPCVGPTLIAIQSLSFQSASADRGALLAFAYCLGLGIPFILAAIGFGAATRANAWLRRHIRAINLAGGALLIVIGLLMVLGVWQSFISWIGFLLPGYVSPL